MFRTIVVGCGGTERSLDALALALQLRHPEGRLLLAAVHPRYGPLTDLRGDHGYAGFMAERSAGILAAAEKRVPYGVPVERHVIADDSVAGALDGLAQAAEADLIVLGSTRRKALGRHTGRCTAQRLLHGAPCAVASAAAKQRERSGGHPRLLVPYDGSPEADAAVSAAYAIALGTSGSVVLLWVVEPIVYIDAYVPGPGDIDAEKQLSTHADDQLEAAASKAPASVPVERRILRGMATPTILDEARSGFDLVVAGSRGYGPVHRVLGGSVSAPLLADGHTAVVVTPRGARTSVPQPGAAATVVAS
jgi:nucleotide-binding universal stress UspA family protein